LGSFDNQLDENLADSANLEPNLSDEQVVQSDLSEEIPILDEIPQETSNEEITDETASEVEMTDEITDETTTQDEISDEITDEIAKDDEIAGINEINKDEQILQDEVSIDEPVLQEIDEQIPQEIDELEATDEAQIQTIKQDKRPRNLEQSEDGFRTQTANSILNAFIDDQAGENLDETISQTASEETQDISEINQETDKTISQADDMTAVLDENMENIDVETTEGINQIAKENEANDIDEVVLDEQITQDFDEQDISQDKQASIDEPNIDEQTDIEEPISQEVSFVEPQNTQEANLDNIDENDILVALGEKTLEEIAPKDEPNFTITTNETQNQDFIKDEIGKEIGDKISDMFNSGALKNALKDLNIKINISFEDKK
nr:hypothetical protein [Campylobacter sp.]